MTMAKSKEEQIFIGANDDVIELTGAEKQAFIADKEERMAQFELRQAELKAKQDSRENAIKKLGEIAGLTKEELLSIL